MIVDKIITLEEFFERRKDFAKMQSVNPESLAKRLIKKALKNDRKEKQK